MSETRPSVAEGFRVGMLTVEKRTAEKRTGTPSGSADVIAEVRSYWIHAAYSGEPLGIAAAPQK